MNRQQNYYDLNNNKKYWKPSSAKYKTTSQKSLFPKNLTNKNIIINQFNNNRLFFSSKYSKNKNKLNKKIRDYQLFVKKYLGDINPIASMTEERMNELFRDQEVNNKIIIDNEKNIIFQKILKNNENLNFKEKDILIKSKEEFIYNINKK